MPKKSTSSSAFFNPRTLIVLLLCSAAACSILIPTRSGLAFLKSQVAANASQRILTFEERVSYQRAIEEVYWRHRIWPRNREERNDSKPPLDAVMSRAQLEKKVTGYLRNAQAMDDHWQPPITAEQLQDEMDRMAQHTKQPEVLHELFEALGNDPFVIAECLARPALAARLVTSSYSYDRKIHGELGKREKVDLGPHPTAFSGKHTEVMARIMPAPDTSFTLPRILDWAACTEDTWTATSTTNAPDARDSHTAVWTGSEMIVWGGSNADGVLDTGGRYDPSTDTWTATSTINAPTARSGHTAVWTGTEMIVWGGTDNSDYFNTGGRYDPSTDTWTATGTSNAPTARSSHTAVWSGSEMIVWGGSQGGFSLFNTGGRYNPNTDSWTATSTTNAPTARFAHTAVWTGSEMIVWGGNDGTTAVNTGGRYNPGTDSWTATSTTNAADGRKYHTAVWTDTEMIVWGGIDFNGSFSNTGGRYNPSTDSWIATSTTNAPDARTAHTAVWTGNEMIVWAGFNAFIGGFLNTGGRYDPGTDSWVATSTTNVPDPRSLHSATWVSNEMIVWGGSGVSGDLNTGGKYCAQGSPTPTPTPTPTATPIPNPRATPTPRPRPTPHPRPTPP
jgi:N-acetylneuraminic acid mutarotase